MIVDIPMPSADWMWGIAGTLAVGALLLYLDKRYERAKPTPSPEKRKLELESLAREVLSTDVLEEFANSTKTNAYQSPEFWNRVECIIGESKQAERVIDARIEHKFNNVDTTLKLTLTNLRDDLKEGMRRELSDSQMIIMDELRNLREAVGALDKKIDVHIAHDSAK